MIQAMNQATGNNVPTNGQPAVPSRADQIRALAKTTPASSAPTSQPSTFGPNLKEAAGAGVNEVKTAVNEGAQKFQIDSNPNGLDTNTQTIKKTGDLLETGLGVASGAASVITSPIAAGIKSILQKAGVSHVLTPEAEQKLNEITTAHPEAAKLIGQALNVGLTAAGSGALGPLEKIPGNVVKATTEGATKAVGAGSDAIDAVKSAIPKIGAQAPNAAAKESGKVLDSLRPTEETMTPTQKKAAIAEGRQTISKTKTGGTKVDYTATPEIQRAAEIIQDKNTLPDPVTSKDAPNVVAAKVDLAIAKRGAAAEAYLEKNPVKITNEEDYNLFQKVRTDAEKSSTETEMKAYDEQLALFNKQLKGMPGGYNTANYYKALKNYETNVASKMARGKDALIDPTGVASAKVQAASDIRKAVRDLIGSKHPDFQPQMYDLASLYEARDAAVQNASKVKSQTFTQKHPVAGKILKHAAIGVGAGAIGAEAIRHTGL